MGHLSDRPVADILLRIVAQRRRRLAAGEADGARWSGDSQPDPLPSTHPFLAALTAHRGRAVIAEVKMGSPRLGRLGERIDPLAQARAYRRAGAAALSVVVEPDFFYGSYELLTACRDAAGLPTIPKDFVVSRRQIELAREAGAAAILLIAALYERDELVSWAQIARGEGLVPLVETHDDSDFEKLAGADWELIGVNNRDLRTFEVDLENSIERVAAVPPGALKVAESGIGSRADVDRLSGAGFDAFLIGETLLLASDPEAVLRELVG